MATLQLEGLVSQENPPQGIEPEVVGIRMQAAVVRSLLEELDEIIPPGSTSSFGRVGATQAVEELAQLACRMLTVAASIAPQRVKELATRQLSLTPNI